MLLGKLTKGLWLHTSPVMRMQCGATASIHMLLTTCCMFRCVLVPSCHPNFLRRRRASLNHLWQIFNAPLETKPCPRTEGFRERFQGEFGFWSMYVVSSSERKALISLLLRIQGPQCKARSHQGYESKLLCRCSRLVTNYTP